MSNKDVNLMNRRKLTRTTAIAVMAGSLAIATYGVASATDSASKQRTEVTVQPEETSGWVAPDGSSKTLSQDEVRALANDYNREHPLPEGSVYSFGLNADHEFVPMEICTRRQATDEERRALPDVVGRTGTVNECKPVGR